MPVHRAAAEGFAAAAEAYERGRPGYPPDAVEWLTQQLGLGPGRTLLDLAAGTGKLTRLLVPTGADVVAVEPVAEMRAALPEEVEALDGTAEAIPLPDGSTDAVVVAQAFHWFDGDAALAEIHRVLRPDGRLAVIYNARDMETPVHQALEDLMAGFREDTPAHRSGRWREAFEHTTLFAPAASFTTRHVQPLDADGLADRVGSVSFVAAMPAGEREALLARARALGPADLPYITEAEVYARAP